MRGLGSYFALAVAAGGDLYAELKRCGGRMDEKRVAADVIQPCLSALSYLHAKVRMRSQPFQMQHTPRIKRLAYCADARPAETGGKGCKIAG